MNKLRYILTSFNFFLTILCVCSGLISINEKEYIIGYINSIMGLINAMLFINNIEYLVDKQ